MKKMTIKKSLKRIFITSLVIIQCMVTVSYGDMIYENSYEITISEGIVHKKVVQMYDSGVQSINLVIADIQNEAVDFEVLYNQVSGFMNRETLTSLVSQNPNTVAAVNADFFSMATPSYSMGPIVDDGKVLSTPHYDPGKMATFMLDESGSAFIDYLKSGVTLKNETRGNSSTGYSINKVSTNFATPVIYTSEYRKKTPGQSAVKNTTITEVIVRNNTVSEVRIGQSLTEIPTDGYAVIASGVKGNALAENFAVGDTVSMETNMTQSYSNIEEAIGGGTMILRDGMLAPITHKITGKSQRTAIGITYDKKIIFMTVDGRKSPYIGMQETDVANFLRTQNVKDAMMFDGGGSTEMIVNKKIVNDLDAERKIVTGAAFVNNRQRGSFSKLEAVLETDNLFQGDRVKLVVQGFDSNMNPVQISGFDVKGSGVSVDYSNGYVTFKSGGNGNVVVSSSGVTTNIPVEVTSANNNDPKKINDMKDFNIAIVPDTSKDKNEVMMQAVNGILLDTINSKTKLAVNYFSKNQTFSDSIKVSKESVYKAAQYVDKDGTRYVGIDSSKGIGATSGQWQAIKSALASNNKNVVIMMNSGMNLDAAEKAVFRKLVQGASKTKSIFIVSKGSEYGSYAEGNVSYITTRDFSNINSSKEDDYKLLVFKQNGSDLTYSFVKILK